MEAWVCVNITLSGNGLGVCDMLTSPRNRICKGKLNSPSISEEKNKECDLELEHIIGQALLE